MMPAALMMATTSRFRPSAMRQTLQAFACREREFDSEVNKLVADSWFHQRTRDRTVKFTNDILRRALGRENSNPVRERESASPELFRVGTSGTGGNRCLAGTGNGFDAAARTYGITLGSPKTEVNLTSDQILMSRAKSTIGDVLKRVPVRSWNKNSASDPVPTPAVPREALSGLAFSQAISSFRLFAGRAFFAARME